MDTHVSSISGEMAEHLRQVADYLRLLARLYYEELDDEVIESFVRTQGVIALRDDMDDVERTFVLGNNKMVRYLQNRNPDTKTQSRCDYARAFLGAGSTREEPVAPFESVYTGTERILMQNARDDIYGIFRSEHIMLDDEYNMPEDHISFELQYLAYVADQTCAHRNHGEADLAAASHEKFLAFFNSHITNWVPRFCEEVLELARTPFYQGLVQCTQAWIAMESELLDCDDHAMEGEAA